MKILFPVDGSTYTKRMLAYVGAQFDWLSGNHECTIFTAVAAVPAYAARFLDRKTVAAYYSDEAEAVLRPVLKFADQHRWTVRASHRPGPAGEAIASLAQELRPDLIVMGTHGHSALGNVILGSVTTAVLARCKVPVLLIR